MMKLFGNLFNKKENRLFVIVSEEQAKSIPYLYVLVEKDGSVRELHASERKYLETPFEGADGNKPFIKDSYKQMNGRGDLGGYCLRSKIPPTIAILDAPEDSPLISSKQKIIEFKMKEAKEKGYEVTVEEDGSLTIKKPNGSTEIVKFLKN
ncbi:MAG: hypothetical protein U0Z26_00855 [Anaerolineales bacterium]